MKIKKLKPRKGKILETLVNSPVFWNEIKKARTKIKNAKDEYGKEKSLTDESRKIVKKLRLPADWLSSIRKCIKENKLSAPTTSNCQLIFERNSKKTLSEIFL